MIISMKLRDKLWKHKGKGPIWKHKGKSPINTSVWGRLRQDIQNEHKYDIDFKPRASEMLPNMDGIEDRVTFEKTKRKRQRSKEALSSSKANIILSLASIDTADASDRLNAK